MYRLRFDVETISKATRLLFRLVPSELRFDVETISKATPKTAPVETSGCGLM